MAYVHVEDFKGGLDRRRMSISGVPGTLYDCINGHITRGAEIEKRKAFVSKYTLPAGTFGMVAAGGLIVFGSGTDPGVPSGVTYQRLQHPDGVSMSAVLRAEVFDGKVYAIAKYTDDSVHHFYDGARIVDWDDGVVRAGMTNNDGIAEHLRALIDADSAYTATRSGATVTITAASAGTPYTITAETANVDGGTDDQGITLTETQANVAPIAEVLATGSFRVTGGTPSVAATGSVQLTGGASGSVDSITVNGVEILGSAVSFNTSLNQTAIDVASQINTYSSSPEYSASASGDTVTISAAQSAGADPNGFVVSSSATTITTSDTNMSGGVTNAITSVKVNGVEVLSTRVSWLTSNSNTATLVAAQITSHTSSPNYTATASGDTVTISAAAGTGAGPNGYIVATTVAGTPTTGSLQDLSGGANAVAGVAQVYTAEVTGTFEAGDRFTITIDGKVFGNAGKPAYKGTWALTYKSKMYAVAESIMYFSKVNDPESWEDSDTGAGFTNMANHSSGSEDLTSLSKYNGNLAIFSRNAIQVWSVDSDDANNVQLHSLEDTGTRAPASVLPIGNIDTFYLDETGIRSLRARDSSGAPVVNDVGVSIDEYLLEYLDTLTDAQVESAVAVLEPRDGRFMLAVGERIFTFSFFRGAKISAWSSYEPGISITHFAVLDKRLYARAGNVIYLYGGDDNATYDTSKVTVTTNFLTAGKAGHKKEITGFDILCEGTWEVRILTDPRDHNKYIRVGTFTNSTPMTYAIPAAHETSHFAVQFVHEAAGAASLSSFIVHFKMKEAA